MSGYILGTFIQLKKNNKIELEGKKGSKFAKIGQFFTLQKIKIEFKVPKNQQKVTKIEKKVGKQKKSKFEPSNRS